MKFSQPHITEREIEAVVAAIRGGDLTTGRITTKFEDKFKELYGYKHVVAVNSGTSALMLGLMALGVGPGDEVIVSPYTMVASVNCVLAVGATPIFADVHRRTYNMDPASVEKLITPRTKAVIPVDIFGVPCDIEGIRAVIPASVSILEDSIEALGSTRQGLPVGTKADMGCFGFFPNKQITCGEGGILYGQNGYLIAKAKALSRHGVVGTTMYHQAFGYNLRLTDMQAAMALVQLERLDELQGMMEAAAKLLDARLPDVRKQQVLSGDTASWFIYSVELPEGVDKKTFISEMEMLGVPVKPYFVSLHKLAHLSDPKYRPLPLPVCEEVDARTVALPLHWELTAQEADQIAQAFRVVVDALKG